MNPLWCAEAELVNHTARAVNTPGIRLKTGKNHSSLHLLYLPTLLQQSLDAGSVPAPTEHALPVFLTTEAIDQNWKSTQRGHTHAPTPLYRSQHLDTVAWKAPHSYPPNNQATCQRWSVDTVPYGETLGLSGPLGCPTGSLTMHGNRLPFIIFSPARAGGDPSFSQPIAFKAHTAESTTDSLNRGYSSCIYC
ncbi:Hypothetical predicted protein [Pelobates cultripes]|uniref:Uncharacterized protein n=1 Tax=Pelobates cultripes TaxID=61616 RepID=A0AAD1RS35_PELCU|nr:Hypothetical predicted protein [Pelobates cultripes]